MKRINNSDIRIRVDKEVLPEKFRFRFFTTDSETYIERNQEDAIVSGDTIFIDLAWQYLQLLSTGIMCYELQRSYPDPRFPDGYYDTVATYSSDYYIESEAQPIPPAESATTLEIVIQLIEDMEELYSTQLSGETSAREALADELHGNYYTSGQTEQYVQDAIDNLNIGSYYTSAQTQEYVGEQVGTERAAREALADELHEDYYTSGQTQEYVNDVIEGKIDLSNYYTSAQTQEYVAEQISGITVDAYTKAETDTKISEATEGLASETWVESQGFLTTETEPAFNASAAKNISSSDISNWDNKSDFSGSYNDLTDKPVIPDVSDYYTSAQTQEYVAEQISGITVDAYTKAETDAKISAATDDMATETWVGQQGYLTTETEPAFNASAAKDISSSDISTWNNKSDFSGDYNDLTNKPVIPDVSGYYTSAQTQQYVSSALTPYYTKTQTDEEILSATEDLASETWVLSQGFLQTETEPAFNASAAKDITSSDISNWNNKSDFSGDYNDLTNKPVIPDVSQYYTSAQTQQYVQGIVNGLKFVACTQAYYDGLVSAGTVDSNTVYYIQESTPPVPPVSLNAIEGTTMGTNDFMTDTNPAVTAHVDNGEFYVLREDLSGLTSLADIFNANWDSESEYRNITSITQFNPDMTNVTSLERAFNDCSEIQSVNLTGLDISNLNSSNLSDMFYSCSNLKSLTLDGWAQANLEKLDAYSNSKNLQLTELSLKDTTYTSDYDVENHFTCDYVEALWLSAGYFQQGSRRVYYFDNDKLHNWTNLQSIQHLATVIPDVTGSQYNDWSLNVPAPTYAVLTNEGLYATITNKGWYVDSSGSE